MRLYALFTKGWADSFHFSIAGMQSASLHLYCWISEPLVKIFVNSNTFFKVDNKSQNYNYHHLCLSYITIIPINRINTSQQHVLTRVCVCVHEREREREREGGRETDRDRERERERETKRERE